MTWQHLALTPLALLVGWLIGYPCGYLIGRYIHLLSPLLCRVLPHDWEHYSWDGEYREMICTHCRKVERRLFASEPIRWRMDSAEESDGQETTSRS